ncbi:MAG: molybdopterin oxidoreductase [SAR202 cluster bacterium Io17-Chloro-G7]|nr:MAG: molybdopterin oxidoreductase [SAR202 cluster bacterium Io17-Chloro-G7]
MQEGRVLPTRQVNADLLKSILHSPKWFWITIALLAIVVLGAMSAAGLMFNKGLGITGLNRPVMWGFFITNFVFWIGISHAGVMLSAILRLSKAEWRRPATRAAEILTVFSLMTAVLMPLIHSGRPWRLIYWVYTLPFVPYDFARGVWPNIRSPLVWDPSAIFTYLTSSILFVMIALLPDFAVLRDRTTGMSHRIYGLLAMGWQGNPRQWKLQIIAGVLLSALILPVFVSVHSIVSWDFGMAVSVKSWHSTIFAPYFVVGAVHSGVSAVVFVLILLRWVYSWQDYIRLEHIDALGRLLIVVATGWFYFFVMEVIFGFYGREVDEIAVRSFQFTQAPWNLWMIFFVGLTYFLPVALWLPRTFRRNLWIMSVACIAVNIGMWLERFLIIVPGLAQKQVFTFDWNTYAPSSIEIVIIAGTFAMVTMLMLLISRVVPLIPLYDIKEGDILKTEIQVGRRTVPATFRED